MKTYTVAEFRKNMRQALDNAEVEAIRITRHDQTFILLTMAAHNEGIVETALEAREVGIAEKNRLATPKHPIDTPPAPVDFEEPCCKGVKPCKHWEHDVANAQWVNILSGRKKEQTL